MMNNSECLLVGYTHISTVVQQQLQDVDVIVPGCIVQWSVAMDILSKMR